MCGDADTVIGSEFRSDRPWHAGRVVRVVVGGQHVVDQNADLHIDIGCGCRCAGDVDYLRSRWGLVLLKVN